MLSWGGLGLGRKKGKDGETLGLLKEENKSQQDGVNYVKVYCVVDKDAAKKDAAMQAIRNKKNNIDNFVKDYSVPEWDDRTVLINDKTIDCGEDVAIEVKFDIAALNLQAVRDGIKVPIDHKALEGWIEKKEGMEFAVEKGDLYPSTHYIMVPYAPHLSNFIAKDKETKHSFAESQLIWLANSLFDFDQLKAKEKNKPGTGIKSYFVMHNLFEKNRDAKLNFGSYFNVFFSESKSYSYSEFNKSKKGKGERTPADELNGDEDVFNRIRNYFGAQTALYFRFAMHMSKWTGGLGIIGALCQAYILYTLDFESPALALFAIMVIVWANLFTEHWKKNELQCTYRWGTDEFDSKEATRTEYKPPAGSAGGKDKDNLIYSYDFEVDNNALMLKQTFSALVIAVIMFCVVCSTVLIYQFKSFLQVEFIEIGVPSQLSATCASLLNLVQIYIFKFLYQFVSTFLNDFENHRTVTEHEDSMISKLTIFTFFNTYISFFYIAFVAGSMSVYTDADDDAISNQCGYTGCMAMLGENLLIVLVMSLTSDKIVEFIILPTVHAMGLDNLNWETIKRIACCQCCASGDSGGSKADKGVIENYRMSPYDFSQRLSDYTTLFTYFGYIVLFSTALPVAPLLVAVSAAFEIRGDLNKMKNFRRTWARAQNIGAWQGCFEVITVAGVICNSAMIVFTMRMFSAYDFVIQIWIFIGMQWVMFSLLALGANVITDVPYKVQIQRRRIEYYKSSLEKLSLPYRDASSDASASKV